jgi:hypothetical protein
MLNEREKRKRKESSERDYLTGETNKLLAMKVPRQCPLVLLVELHRRDGGAFSSGEGARLI